MNQYKTILDNGKGQKLDTILEMCKEIDEGRTETNKTSEERSNVGFGPKMLALTGEDHDHNQSTDDEKKSKGTKSTFSYSVKKEITETMTLTKET